MDVLDYAMGVLEEAQITRHRLTVDEYYRMAEVGVLAPDAKVELIDGEIIDMAPMGTLHYAAVARLNRLLTFAAGESALVLVQLPVRLSQRNEPEPDLALLKPQDDYYGKALPSGRDCFLVIEVSDTTLAYDLRVKAPLYAQHGVPEYWVFDLPNQQLRVFRQPQGDAWAEAIVLKQPGRIALPGLPGLELDLTGIF